MSSGTLSGTKSGVQHHRPSHRGGRGGGSDLPLALAMLAPAFAIFAVVIVAPVLRGIVASFQDATLATQDNPSWVGLDNYRELFVDNQIFVYVGNTLYFVSGTVGVLLLLGLGMALLLNFSMPGQRIARTLALVPWVVPSVVVALLWSWIFQPQYGILNYLLSGVGLVAEDQQWLTDPTLAMPAVIVAAVWRELPLMTLLLLAGLQTVSTELLEAARVDGASAFRRLWHVILPALRSTGTTAVLIAVINNFQSFTLMFTMTGGGPLQATTTLSIGTYEAAFKRYDLGLGSAIGVLWLLVLVLIAAVVRRAADRAED